MFVMFEQRNKTQYRTEVSLHVLELLPNNSWKVHNTIIVTTDDNSTTHQIMKTLVAKRKIPLSSLPMEDWHKAYYSIAYEIDEDGKEILKKYTDLQCNYKYGTIRKLNKATSSTQLLALVRSI